MSNRRRWYTPLVVIPLTGVRAVLAFRNQGIGRFAPFVFLLLFGSALLWVINTIAPLAPFIYSLF
jgi:hypothetical protein